MSESPVLYEKSDHVVTITMNRPEKRNAIDSALHEGLELILEDLSTDPDVGAIVLTGAGKAFCAGHDLKQARAHEDLDYQRRLFGRSSEIMQRIVARPQPVIARVHGMTTAAGCQLVAGCDLAVAAAEAGAEAAQAAADKADRIFQKGMRK